MSYTDPEPAPEPIPECAYLKRKGATVNSVDDLLAWSPFLAEYPDKYEPFVGKVPAVDLRNRKEAQEAIRSQERISLILEGMEVLDPDKDFTPQGLPSIEALRRIVDENVTLDERNQAWILYERKRPVVSTASMVKPKK